MSAVEEFDRKVAGVMDAVRLEMMVQEAALAAEVARDKEELRLWLDNLDPQGLDKVPVDGGPRTYHFCGPSCRGHGK